MASWIRTPAPLPFPEAVKRAGGELLATQRWTYDAGVEGGADGARVIHSGPVAREQGLQEGDVIVSIAGQPVANAESFREGLHPTGAPVPVRVRRGPDTLELRLHRVPRKDYEIRTSDGGALGSLLASPPSGGQDP